MIDDVLREHIGKICYVYIDDIIVFSKDYESHWRNLRAVFEKLRQAKLQVNLEKTQFLRTQIEKIFKCGKKYMTRKCVPSRFRDK